MRGVPATSPKRRAKPKATWNRNRQPNKVEKGARNEAGRVTDISLGEGRPRAASKKKPPPVAVRASAARGNARKRAIPTAGGTRAHAGLAASCNM